MCLPLSHFKLAALLIQIMVKKCVLKQHITCLALLSHKPAFAIY